MCMSRTRLDAQGYPDEAWLITRAIENDAAAVRLIMQRNNRRLYRVARGVVRDDNEAEDVLQEAYLRAFSALADFRGESSLSTWLTRIVLNEALQRLRRRTDVPVSDIDKDAEGRAPKSFLTPRRNQRSTRNGPWRNNSSVSSSNEQSTRFRAIFVRSSSPGLSKA